jgi:hypothetical protein
VPSVEFWVLLGSIIFVSLFSTWAHYKITQWAASALAMQVQELNEALGEALQIVGNNPMAQENPLVGIIGRILEKQVDAPVKAKLVEQDDKGRFVKKIE